VVGTGSMAAACTQATEMDTARTAFANFIMFSSGGS
jgi:hypothetical protein